MGIVRAPKYVTVFTKHGLVSQTSALHSLEMLVFTIRKGK